MLDIVIVNWNSGEQLYHVMESIATYHAKLVTSVVIVDNASADNSLELIAQNSDDFDIRIIRNEVNIGFGAACNQGAGYCDSTYLLFLNPDALLYKETLQTAIDFMNNPQQADVGVCGVQLVDEHNVISRSCARFPTPFTFFLTGFGLTKMRIFASRSLHMHDWDHSTTQTVDHVIGAFYLIRNSLFKQLHGFDERYFVYLEDLDLSYRVKQNGYRSVYLAQAQSFHKGGGTSDQVKAIRLFYSLRSRLLYADKNFNKMGSVVVLTTTLLIEPLSRSMFAILRVSYKQLTETFGGYRRLYAWVPRWLIGRVPG